MDGSSPAVTVEAQGHEHVSARHTSTLEITTDDWLTPAGDCILGIGADLPPSGFDPAFPRAARDAEARIDIELEVDGASGTLTAWGHPDLTFDSDRSMVVRTSEYVDDRTVAVRADAAAADLDRELVAALAEGGSLTCRLTVR